MAVDTIGLNLSAFSNINMSGLNITTDPTVILAEAPTIANNSTTFLAWGITIGMFLILYLSLSDRTGFGKERYSDLRALGLSFGIIAIMQTILVLTGMIWDVKPLFFSIGIFSLVQIAITFAEGKD